MNMKEIIPAGKFHLSKWFLDFIGDDGNAMIFYSAKLTWHHWSASYTSRLNYHPDTGVILKSRFHHVPVPLLKDNTISWTDPRTEVSGTWEGLAKSIHSRLYDSREGYLDWTCYQPASRVQLRIKENVVKGTGYAEKLVLTAVPWIIPMDELRWGRFGAGENIIVWIELRQKERKKWLWLNGERIEQCIIEDDHIILPEKDMDLNLDRGVLLESEKKISSVVDKVARYIPGFSKVLPLQFLMADEFKWLSKAKLNHQGIAVASGMAIHELVNFKAFTE